MSLSNYEIKAEDFKDTSSIDSMISELDGIDRNDANGYTPLCFAVLNGVEPRLLLYLINKKGASTGKKCAKGKTPIQLACTAMNADAVGVLIGLDITYNAVDDNGNLVQAYSNHLPSFIDSDGRETNSPTDDDGNPNEVAYKQITENIGSKASQVTDNDILEASKLTKEDILVKLLEKYCNCPQVQPPSHNSNTQFTNIKDSNNNNPLHLAVLASCYGSVDALLEHSSNRMALIIDKNDDDTSAYDIAKTNEDIGILEKFFSHATSASELAALEELLVENKDNDDIVNILMPCIVSYVCGNSEYYSYTNPYNCSSYTNYTTQTLSPQTTVNLPDNTTLFSYYETALDYSDNSNSNLYNALVNQFFLNADTVRQINDSSHPIVDECCYNILNLLNDNNRLVISNSYGIITNSSDNKQCIVEAVNSSHLDFSKLTNWPWWKVTISFRNIYYPDLDITLPEDSDYVSGSEITLPELTDIYTDSHGTKYHAVKWYINGVAHNFNSSYILDEDATAFISCEEIHVTLYYEESYNLVGLTLPESRSESSGTNIVLPYINSQPDYADTDNIRWVPYSWDIGAFGSTFNLTEDTTAHLQCLKKSVTLTFSNPYSDVEIPIEQITLHKESGDEVILQTIDGTYENTSHTMSYIPRYWTVDSATYEFGSSFKIYDNTTLTLYCDTFSLSADIVFNNELIALQEGSSQQVAFTLSTEPTSNVTLDFDSASNNRLSISPASITFSQLNYADEQYITFEAISDDIDYDTVTVSVSISVSSYDTRYNNLSGKTLSITVEDDDTAGVNYITDQSVLKEGDALDRTFKLQSDPLDDVTLHLSTSPSGYITLSQDSLTFNSSNWNNTQFVRFTALENNVSNDDTQVSVVISVDSNDTKYSSLTLTPIVINVTDNSAFGTLAFESGYFTVGFVDDDDKMCTVDNTADNVLNVWSDCYSTGYTVVQIPISPHYLDPDPAKHFEYDLLYDQDINFKKLNDE